MNKIIGHLLWSEALHVRALDDMIEEVARVRDVRVHRNLFVRLFYIIFSFIYETIAKYAP